MSVIARRVIVGLVSGAAAALLVDLRAWSANDKPDGQPWDWRVAAKHVLYGAIAGATSSIGLTVATPV